MTLRVGEVQAVNFGPFESMSIDLSRPGLTVIEGQVANRNALSDNGAGKSTIFHSVMWALYGRTMSPRLGGDDVVREGSEGGTSVQVEVSGEGRQVHVRRYRKHRRHKNNVYVWIDGEHASRGTNKATDELIEKLIGLDYRSFLNSVAFGARDEVKSFFTASDQERKELFDSILGLEVYDEAEKVARNHLRQLEDKKRELDNSLVSWRNTAEERWNLVRQMEAEVDQEDEVNLKQRLARANYLMIQARELRELAAWMREYRERQKKLYDDDYQRYKENLKAIREKRKEAESKLRDLRSDRGRWEKEIERSDARLEKVSDVEHSTCPTCEQEVPSEHVRSIIEEEKSNRSNATYRLEATDMEISYWEQYLESLAEPEEPVNQEVDMAEREAEQFEDRAKRIEKDAEMERSTARRGLKEKRQRDDRREKMEAKATKADSEVNRIEGEIEEVDRGLEVYQFWAEAFGARGIRSFLIENELPRLNKRATRYARRLLGDGASVRVEATTQLKSKRAERERMSVEAVIPGMAQTYSAASKGQRQRLDLAVLLAFRDLVSERSSNPFGQLFVDELFDGLDQAGRESVMELLHEKAAGSPVALITHDPDLKRAARRTIRAYHNGKAATLVES